MLTFVGTVDYGCFRCSLDRCERSSFTKLVCKSAPQSPPTWMLRYSAEFFHSFYLPRRWHGLRFSLFSPVAVASSSPSNEAPPRQHLLSPLATLLPLHLLLLVHFHLLLPGPAHLRERHQRQGLHAHVSRPLETWGSQALRVPPGGSLVSVVVAIVVCCCCCRLNLINARDRWKNVER